MPPSGDWPAAVVFDCDGVLIESVDIKTAAFLTLYPEYPEHHQAIADHHQQHLGVSRFEKFDWIANELLGAPLTPPERTRLGECFARYVYDRAVACPQVAGAERTLAALRELPRPAFVASGIPHDELARLVGARGWADCFRGVYGSPTAKASILRSIAAGLDVEPSELVFVGDGWSDYQAAIETGAVFCLRETSAQASRFEGYDGARIADLRGFVSKLPLLRGVG